MSKSKQEARLNALEFYVREILARKDTRHAPEVIEFLQLDSLAGDLLYNQPQLQVS
jgi:hypothetical protein